MPSIFSGSLVLKIALFLIPAYTWSRFFKLWTRLNLKLNNQKLFYDRHNCIVMYAPERSAVGWMNTSLSPSLGNQPNLYDSVVYFIQTAKKSLDVAMMVIDHDVLVQAIVQAHKRGVAVRVLLDYNYSKKSKSRGLENSGIPVLYYMCPNPEVCSIMHCKYILKDYSKENGYIYFGSLNWSAIGAQINYEDTVFTTNRSIVRALHNHFEEIWSFIEYLNKSDSYVKAKLLGIQ